MTTNLTFKLTAAAALTFCSLALQAEETVQTSEVTVTAGRVEQQLLEVPMAVTVVTNQEIQESAARNVGELLEDIPGVMVNNAGSQGLKRVSIRGEDTFRTLTLIDGQKISEQKSMSGASILIDPSSIERIEVIKGPASVLYGSDALGGVVNIITKKGSKKPFEAEGSVARNGAGHGWAETISLGGTYKGLNYHLDAGYQSHGNIKTPLGYQKGTDFRQKNASAFLSYDFNEHFTAGLRADTFDSDINSSSWEYEQDPNSEFFVRIPKWKRDKVALFAEGKNLNEYLTRLRWDGYWQKNHKNMRNYVLVSPFPTAKVITDSLADNRIKTYGTSLQADWQLGESNFLITGYEFVQDQLEVDTDARSSMSMRSMLMSDTQTHRFNKGKETTNAIFASMETSLPMDFMVNYGVRYTWVNSKLSKASASLNGFDRNGQYKNFDDGSAGKTGSDRNSRPVFNLSLNWTGLPDTSLRAGWSQGFRVPNLQEKYLMNSMGGGTIFGNPNLKPEKSNNFEIGARYAGSAVEADFALFYNLADDYISTIRIYPDVGTKSQYTYENADKAKTFGAELSVNFKPTNHIFPYASMTWLRRKTEWGSGVSTYDSGVAGFTARYGVKTEFEVFNGRWNTDTYLRSKTASKSYSPNTSETTRVAGYTTLNFATTYHFGSQKRYMVSAEAINITNQLYSYGDSIYEPGRHFNFKLSAKY